MYFQDDINQLRQDEQLAHALLQDQQQPEPVQIACVIYWESCALWCLEQHPTRYALCMAAVKTWLSCSDQALHNPVHQDLLCGCAVHHLHAQQLLHHPDPLIRAACAQWEDLAEQLQRDPVNWVRIASQQHSTAQAPQGTRSYA